MAAITDQVLWRRVLNHVAADLKMLASIAAGEKIIVEQATPANLKASVQQIPGALPMWPPPGAVAVNEATHLSGSGELVLYNVPANQILYVTTFWVGMSLSADAHGYTYISLHDEEDVVQYYFFQQDWRAKGNLAISISYIPALKGTDSDHIEIKSSHANTEVYAGIHGWKVPE